MLGLWAYIYYILDFQIIFADKIILIIILLRLFRLVLFLNEIEMWQNFTKTIGNLLGPFQTLLLALYSLYFLFAIIGVRWLGGLINKDSMKIIVATNSDIPF